MWFVFKGIWFLSLWRERTGMTALPPPELNSPAVPKHSATSGESSKAGWLRTGRQIDLANFTVQLLRALSASDRSRSEVPDGVVQERMVFGLSSHISVGYAQPTKQFIRALKRWPGPFSQHDGLAPNRRGQP